MSNIFEGSPVTAEEITPVVDREAKDLATLTFLDSGLRLLHKADLEVGLITTLYDKLPEKIIDPWTRKPRDYTLKEILAFTQDLWLEDVHESGTQISEEEWKTRTHTLAVSFGRRGFSKTSNPAKIRSRVSNRVALANTYDISVVRQQSITQQQQLCERRFARSAKLFEAFIKSVSGVVELSEKVPRLHPDHVPTVISYVDAMIAKSFPEDSRSQERLAAAEAQVSALRSQNKQLLDANTQLVEKNALQTQLIETQTVVLKHREESINAFVDVTKRLDALVPTLFRRGKYAVKLEGDTPVSRVISFYSAIVDRVKDLAEASRPLIRWMGEVYFGLVPYTSDFEEKAMDAIKKDKGSLFHHLGINL